MTNLLFQLSFLDSLPFVTLAYDSQIKVCGTGQTQPLPSLPLQSVLFAPGYPFNLISISKLTCSLNFSDLFVNNSILVQDWRTGRTIGIGHESWGSYQLSLSIACVSTASPGLAHQCLGHPSLDKLCLLVPSLCTLKSLQCKSCQLGKHVCYSYSPRVNKIAASPFTLVDSDIWGLSWVCSPLEFFYCHFYWWFFLLYLGFLTEKSIRCFLCLLKFLTWNS